VAIFLSDYGFDFSCNLFCCVLLQSGFLNLTRHIIKYKRDKNKNEMFSHVSSPLNNFSGSFIRVTCEHIAAIITGVTVIFHLTGD